MDIKLVPAVLKQVVVDLGRANESIGKELLRLLPWNHETNNKAVRISLDAFNTTELGLIKKALLKHKEVPARRTAASRIDKWLTMNDSPDSFRVRDLKMLEEVGKRVLAALPNQWVFSEEQDGKFVGWHVENITYHPSEEWSPAHVMLELVAFKRNKRFTQTATIYSEDLTEAGSTLESVLERYDLYLEDEKLLKEYHEHMKRFDEIGCMTGHQFNASGKAFVEETDEDRSWWYNTTTFWWPMFRGGAPTKVVMDDTEAEEEKESNTTTRWGRRNKRNDKENSPYADTSIWTKFRTRNKRDNDDSDSEEDSASDGVAPVKLPIHPYTRVFDLEEHRMCLVHVDNLKEYEYSPTLVQKLVLPPAIDSLVKSLLETAGNQMKDIVAGKAMGVILVSTGVPGTGKTSTGELYSEYARKPLYSVQCAQLGTTEEALEKQLSLVLNRAQRWQAILQLDEADVYVRERGDDIKQNAIVGVFLRVLEYYRGILLMTSNKEVVIDDAILSRASAHIRYDVPKDTGQAKVWGIMLQQYDMDMSDSVMLRVIKNWPQLAPRTVRNLLRLIWSLKQAQKSKDKSVTFDEVKYAAQFHSRFTETKE